MTMDPHDLVRNYSLPLLIAIVSLIGICIIVAAVWSPMPNVPAVPTRTVTPFKYLLLATETAIFTPTPVAVVSTEFRFVPTETSEIANPDTNITPFSAATSQNRVFTEEFFTSTVTITPDPLFDEVEPMTAGTYEDIDSHIIRKGNWSSQNHVDASGGKLLVSNAVGNYLVIRFTGYQMGLGYQSNDTAGEITINIDGAELTINQLVGNLWVSEEFAPGTHNVIITHASGSQINLDYIEILE